MANPAKFVWLDDGLKDAAQSGLPIVNAGLHYGFSVFEGIRCYATSGGPAVFRLEEHVDRLLDSALIVGFRDLVWTRDSLIDAIHKTVSANKFSACYIRPVIYLEGAMDRSQGARHSRQHCIFHPAAPEHHDDQGQGLRKLREFDSGQDRIAACRLR